MLFEWQKFEAVKLSLFGFSFKSGLHSLPRVCFGFASLRLVIGWKKKKIRATFSATQNAKKKHDSLAHIFLRFTSTACICFEFWLDKGIVFFVIGQCDNFGLVLWHAIEVFKLLGMQYSWEVQHVIWMGVNLLPSSRFWSWTRSGPWK